MVHLAGLPMSTWTGIAELAQAVGVSQAFLTKVVQRLVLSGLMVSHRGPKGGFALSVPAGEISLLNVVEAIEGPIQLNLCTGVCATPATSCYRQPSCAVHVVWLEAQAKLREVLGQATLETLARDSAQQFEAIQVLP